MKNERIMKATVTTKRIKELKAWSDILSVFGIKLSSPLLTQEFKKNAVLKGDYYEIYPLPHTKS